MAICSIWPTRQCEFNSVVRTNHLESCSGGFSTGSEIKRGVYSTEARLSSPSGLALQKSQTPPSKLLLTSSSSSSICRHLFTTEESNFAICPLDLQQQLFTLQMGASRAASRFAASVISNVRCMKQTSTSSRSFIHFMKCADTVDHIWV